MKMQKNEDGSMGDDPELAARPEAADERQIEDLIQEHLVQNLEILPEQELAVALHDFVEKVGILVGPCVPGSAS